jgi:hypothetical protein
MMGVSSYATLSLDAMEILSQRNGVQPDLLAVLRDEMLELPGFDDGEEPESDDADVSRMCCFGGYGELVNDAASDSRRHARSDPSRRGGSATTRPRSASRRKTTVLLSCLARSLEP